MTYRGRPGSPVKEPRGPSASRWRGLLKLVVSAATLAFVVHAVPMDEVGAVLTSAAPGWLLAALMLFTATQAVSALRFAYIAQDLGVALPFGRSLRLHYIGLWLNQVLPTGLGGDVVKAAMLRHDVGLGTAVRVAVLDRLSGLIVLLLHAAALLPLYVTRFPDAYPLHAVCLMSLGGLVLLAAVVATVSRVDKRWGHLRAISQILALVRDVRRLFRWPSLSRQALTSAVVHVNGMAVYALIGKAVGVDISAVDYALISPMVFLVALIPMSFAGWGLRELGAVWLFGLAGVGSHLALAVSIAFGFLMITAGIPGLLALLFIQTANVEQDARRL